MIDGATRLRLTVRICHDRLDARAPQIAPRRGSCLSGVRETPAVSPAPRSCSSAGGRGAWSSSGRHLDRRCGTPACPGTIRRWDHLREWLAVDKATFYDPAAFALVPMGFCYPGNKAGGDLPPRPECAPLWHERLLRQVRPDGVVLLVGQYAQDYYLPRAQRRGSLTETVRAFEDYLPRFFPLPHPSWRSKLWMARNPWFGRTLLPRLRTLVRRA